MAGNTTNHDRRIALADRLVDAGIRRGCIEVKRQFGCAGHVEQIEVADVAIHKANCASEIRYWVLQSLNADARGRRTDNQVEHRGN